MSDIREAFEALIKYRKAYDEMYQMLGMFLDAEEGLEKPDIDQAWSAFNQAPGPVYWERIEAALQSQAALSANGGEAVTPVWDNKILVSNIVRAFWRRIYTYKDRYPAKELPREVPIELYCAMSTALIHLGNESLNPKHPAPPSVAVPDGWKLVPTEPTCEMKRIAMKEGAKTLHDYAGHDAWCHTVYRAMLAAAPQPDHSPDAGKVVQGKNRYGLDMGYFSRLIAREFDDLSNFRPDEFARVCARMAATADASVLQEKEFRPAPVPVPWPKKEDITEDMRAGFERLYRAEAERDGRTLERNEQGAYKHLTVDRDWTFYQRVWADALEATAPAADGGEVEPLGYLTNQAVARLQSDKRLNGEHLYAFKPDDMSKFQAVYLGPAVKESLTAAHPAQPRNGVQAEALEEFANDMKGLAERNRNLKTAGGVLVASQEAEAKAKRLRSNGGDV